MLFINDYFFVPSQIGLTTSKIEWRNDLGITVESSVDGIAYSQCVNGQPLPQYTKDSFSSSGNVYIKITMSTSDASKYLPKLSFFCITFYADRTIYADNFGDKITSSTDYYLGSLNYPILSRHYMNGIRAKNGSGFNLNSSTSVKSIEMFFTPLTLAANTLFYASDPSDTRLAWNGSGVVSKANIAKIYVNNVDVTNQTNISSYLVEEEPHHIVIVFTTPVTGEFKLNYESTGGPSNLYKNIATYDSELTAPKVETHFELYLSITSKKGNRSRIDALAREVRTFGIYEGGPKFLSARRKITDEEYAEQEQRLKWGLVPDPLDIGNYKDEIKNLRAEGQ